MPSTRKDLMFERRRREEADGESRMMGSGLRFAFLETGPFGVGMRAGVGACFEERERKAAVYFLTWEKSCSTRLAIGLATEDEC